MHDFRQQLRCKCGEYHTGRKMLNGASGGGPRDPYGCKDSPYHNGNCRKGRVRQYAF